jgi:hypothetical protein
MKLTKPSLVANEVDKTISKLCDGETLKMTFWRSFSPKMMNLWFDLEGIEQNLFSFKKQNVIPCVGNMNLKVLTLSNLAMT